ncbi:MAG: UDP-N-acetylglucosamine 2-epimerase [uncultured Sphingomonadaceae bacterium]|uniref:UDP-N-acetylglucosamine 2-epimerase (non-hydrolyzing) n=1 Tax=uncultured Sphingomonadaceae bacterium TaxID=169976 RepID=A0A6J4S9F6_9SPHN|nr:MAG: UDP-N-acetylglucosamine 2-epimerase [uncultured Sphingomonadaceae bacterium]
MSGGAVAAIIGTRPEAIKMAPVLRALNRRGIGCTLLCTGQHPQLDLQGAGMPMGPVVALGLDARGIDADAMCAAIEALASDQLARTGPRLVLVQGDTNSALAGARAAHRLGIAVGHVEAGLRTHDLSDPWPEERNRVEIARIATLHFAPTTAARRALAAERVGGTIIHSGNSGIDALLDTAADVGPVDRAGPPTIMVTVHRRENRGAGVARIGCALRAIAAREDVRFVVPLHPNGQARGEMLTATEGLRGLTTTGPLTYRATVELMLRSHLILTDSGGLQEEAAALGRPLLILRNSTERPEVIESGNALLVGTDPERVATETLRLLRDADAHARMSVPAFPFGEGGASGDERGIAVQRAADQ